MKNVTICVSGGFASIQSNESNVNVLIIDHDSNEELEFSGIEDVVIEVNKGIADVTKCIDGVDIEIIDRDNEMNQ